MKFFKYVLIFILLIGVLLFVLYFMITTTVGSKFIVDRSIAQVAEYENLVYESMKGDLKNGLTFKNLELKNIKGLLDGTKIKIQRLYCTLNSFDLNGVVVEIENGRLSFPDSDPIVASGIFKEQNLDFNIFSRSTTITEIFSYLPDYKGLIPIDGDVHSIDLFITGNYLEPFVKGDLLIKRFVYKGFLLTEAPITLDVQLKEIKKDARLFGKVYLKEGIFQTSKVKVNLGEGNLKFNGAWDKPEINLKGTSKVEKTKIDIRLRGTVDKPDLVLSSEQGFSQQKLMVMLATGKSWQSVENSLDNGNLSSAALSKDFIDYFFFAGKSNKFAERFGISDFSLNYDENRKGVSAKKMISEKVEVGYGIEQSDNVDQLKDVTQKFGGQYNVSEKISVNVEREMKQRQSLDPLIDESIENNDKILLKYKKSF